MQISTFVLPQHLLKAPFLGNIWPLVTSSLCSENFPLHILIINFFCPLLKKWIKAGKIEMTTIFRSKRTSSPYCQNPLLHFYIFLSFFFFFLRHQLAPQSEFCVWRARSVNYKNSSFKASFALFCGKKFPLSRNCSGTRDNCLRCFPNSICPDGQSNFRNCVILLKLIWRIPRKEKLIKEHLLCVRHHVCLVSFSFLSRQGE